MTRHSALERSELIASRYPLIADAAAVIADPLVRNRGTTGGSLAHADPAGDLGSVMTALGAEVIVNGPGGERTLPIDELLLGPFMTTLEEGEILTEVRVPQPAERSGGAYEKLERKVGDFATAAVAVQLTRENGQLRLDRHRPDGSRADDDPRQRGRGRAARRQPRRGRAAGRRRAGGRRLGPGRGPARLRGVQARHGAGAHPASPAASRRAGGRVGQ